VPDDLDVVRVLEVLERQLEVTLADDAERADDVAPDVDLHADVNTVDCSTIPTCAGRDDPSRRRPEAGA